MEMELKITLKMFLELCDKDLVLEVSSTEGEILLLGKAKDLLYHLDEKFNKPIVEIFEGNYLVDKDEDGLVKFSELRVMVYM